MCFYPKLLFGRPATGTDILFYNIFSILCLIVHRMNNVNYLLLITFIYFMKPTWTLCQLWVCILQNFTCIPFNSIGWSKGSEYCNITMIYWKMPKWDKWFFFIKEFILGGLIIYHSINLSKKVGPLKKIPFFGKSM